MFPIILLARPSMQLQRPTNTPPRPITPEDLNPHCPFPGPPLGIPWYAALPTLDHQHRAEWGGTIEARLR